jgi:hypothetical protein
MAASLDQLLERARRIGVDQIAYPIDVFSVAHDIASHADARSRISAILSLVVDRENHFTRWAGVRAISALGPEAIASARETLARQLQVEDYALTKKELLSALSKVGQPT